jgi:hypothetical protein
MRHGRSRCCSKIGPSSRAHQRASVVRRQAERAAEQGQRGRSQSEPMAVMFDEKEARRD